MFNGEKGLDIFGPSLQAAAVVLSLDSCLRSSSFPAQHVLEVGGSKGAN